MFSFFMVGYSSSKELGRMTLGEILAKINEYMVGHLS